MTGLAVSTVGLVHVYRTEGHDVAGLSGVDLFIAPGEMLALLGPSGAGKSTLLNLLGGLLRPSAGRIRIGDRELTKLTARELDDLRGQDVVLVVQGAERNLLPFLSVRENVLLTQKLSKHPNLPDVDDVLTRAGIDGDADTRIDKLNPARAQLAAIAAATAAGPGLVLADEPTSRLDHASRDRVLDALTRLSADHGTTVVLVTHDPHVAAAMPRTVTIRDGRIGGEGRSGQEYAVVNADGSMTFPEHALRVLPPGTLVQVRDQDGELVLRPVETTTGGDADV